MFKNGFYRLFAIVSILILISCFELKAEINFDFGLPLFRQNEINFEKTKPADYNLQLLKKYILEHEGNIIAQYHAITRWFTLIKLSDTPKHAELIKEGDKYFSLDNKEKPSKEEKLRNIFYKGLLLCNNKTEDSESKKEQEYEELLLNNEDDLHDKADYWIAKGIIFQSLKNKSNNYFSLMKPEEDLKTALTLIPKSAQYFYVMGQCFRYLGSSDSALFLSIASYEKAASLDPRNQKLQNSLLCIYMGLHEEYQAKGKHEPFWLEEAVYKKIIEIAPTNPYALNNLGYLYAEYGVNTQTAMELCQKAVEQVPENAGFQDSLGWAAFKNKNFKLAEEALLKSISLRNNVYESHYHLATVYYSLNNYKKASEQYELAINLKPDSAEALNNLAYLYTELNTNSEKALEMAKLANSIEPNNASYLDTLGWAYYRNNDLDNALLYLKKADSLIPAQSEILLHIGRVYLDKNEFDNALAYVKEAFKVNPNLYDPDDTLYLTIRLKSYNESLASYHGVLGKKADKRKILSILMDISKLYQEEGLYDKSIEITKICSELNNGTKSLEEPLLNTYKLQKNIKLDDKKKEIQPTNPVIEEVDNDTKEKDNSNNNKTSQIDKSPIVEDNEKKEENKALSFINDLDYPIAISFCSDFINNISKFIPQAKYLEKCNFTIIVDRLMNSYETAIYRISSKTLTGEEIKTNFLFFDKSMTNTEKITDKNIDQTVKVFDETFFYKVKKNEVYFSKKPFSVESLASFSLILPCKDENLIEIYFDYESFSKRYPKFINGFIKNPFKPFTKIQASYKLENESINEFIVASSDQEMTDEFIKKIAGRLFRFKVRANKIGLNTTIKMKNENNLIYISTDFENIIDWISQKVNIINNEISHYIPFIIKTFSK